MAMHSHESVKGRQEYRRMSAFIHRCQACHYAVKCRGADAKLPLWQASLCLNQFHQSAWVCHMILSCLCRDFLIFSAHQPTSTNFGPSEAYDWTLSLSSFAFAKPLCQATKVCRIEICRAHAHVPAMLSQSRIGQSLPVLCKICRTSRDTLAHLEVRTHWRMTSSLTEFTCEGPDHRFTVLDYSRQCYKSADLTPTPWQRNWHSSPCCLPKGNLLQTFPLLFLTSSRYPRLTKLLQLQEREHLCRYRFVRTSLYVCMFSTASLIPSHAHRFFLFTFWFRFPRLKTFHLFAPETLDPQRKSEGNLPQRLVWTLVATPGILLNHFGGFQWTSLKTLRRDEEFIAVSSSCHLTLCCMQKVIDLQYLLDISSNFLYNISSSASLPSLAFLTPSSSALTPPKPTPCHPNPRICMPDVWKSISHIFHTFFKAKQLIFAGGSWRAA